jgi:hypothetical protein
VGRDGDGAGHAPDGLDERPTRDASGFRHHVRLRAKKGELRSESYRGLSSI